MTSSADSVVAQLESLTKNVPKDEASRKQLLEAARGLAFALESPGDSIQRICYLVNSQPYSSHDYMLIVHCNLIAASTYNCAGW